LVDRNQRPAYYFPWLFLFKRGCLAAPDRLAPVGGQPRRRQAIEILSLHRDASNPPRAVVSERRWAWSTLRTIIPLNSRASCSASCHARGATTLSNGLGYQLLELAVE
jgi:hypothetical protein